MTMLKQAMVANLQPHGKTSFYNLERMIRCQIDNSLDIGWNPENIILITNFNYLYKGVKAIPITLNKHCLTGSKIFAAQYILNKTNLIDSDQILWIHDLDVWQNTKMDIPDMKDVGLCYYSRPKFNGGSQFYRPSANDLLDTIANIITTEKQAKEEPVLDKVLKDNPVNHERVTVLSTGYNIGCSGYVERVLQAKGNYYCLHFHPTNNMACQTHLLDRNALEISGETPRIISPRLEQILRSYFPEVPTVLPEGFDIQAEKYLKRTGQKLKPA